MDWKRDSKNKRGTGKMMKELKDLMKTPVRDRTNYEHQCLIQMAFNGNVRDYFLSMGEFKEEKKYYNPYINCARCNKSIFNFIEEFEFKCIACNKHHTFTDIQPELIKEAQGK